ncbi:14707_t:CDS:2, partial [Acaulospora colombiana]
LTESALLQELDGLAALESQMTRNLEALRSQRHLIMLPSDANKLLSLSEIPVAVASLSREISLLLVGCIILISVRTVLRQVGHLIKSSSRTIGAAFLLLFLAQLMLRSAFPPNKHQAPPATDHPDTMPPRSENDPQVNLFSSLPEYQLFGLLFDGSFLAAAAATAAMIWAHRQLNRAEIFT